MMTERTSGGFEEIAHTADWAMRVWAQDFPALIPTAIQGMQSLMGLELHAGPRTEKTLSLDGIDREAILVSALSEVLYLLEHEGLGVETCRVQAEGSSIVARLGLLPAANRGKEIKAVTFHGLSIQQTARGLETLLVFDV